MALVSLLGGLCYGQPVKVEVMRAVAHWDNGFSTTPAPVFGFFVFAEFEADASRVQATLTGPNGAVPLVRSEDGGLEYAQDFVTSEARDAAFPAGQYTLTFSGAVSGTYPFALPEEEPPYLQERNPRALQTIPDPAETTVTWRRVTNYMRDDVITIGVTSEDGEFEYMSPLPGEPGAIPGSAWEHDVWLPPFKKLGFLIIYWRHPTVARFEDGSVVVAAQTLMKYFFAETREQPIAPEFQIPPATRHVLAGESVAFSVNVDAEPKATYSWYWRKPGELEWRRSDSALGMSGGDSSRLTLATVSAEMDGYELKCSARNTKGTTDSPVARLFVKDGYTVGPLTEAGFREPAGMDWDGAGNLFVADPADHVVRRITANGAVETFAGAPGQVGGNDGSRLAARFSAPVDVCVGPEGDLYVLDADGAVVRRVGTDGQVTTIAGSYGEHGYADGPGAQARFRSPQGIAVSRVGDVFVADSGNHVIRKIDTLGVVTTLAGTPGTTGVRNGASSEAQFNNPVDVACRADGSVVVADSGNHAVRVIAADGTVSTLAGFPGHSGQVDEVGARARLNGPSRLAVDSADVVFVADDNGRTLRRISPERVVFTIAGQSGISGSNDGGGRAASFGQIQGLAVGADGAIAVADGGNASIRRGVPWWQPRLASDGVPQSVEAGEPLQLHLALEEQPVGPVRIQWFFRGEALEGETSESLTVPVALPQLADAYSVRLSAEGVTALLDVPVPEVVRPASSNARLLNISTRAFIPGADQPLIPGFVVTGSEPVQVMVRGVGETLADFGVQGILADPWISLKRRVDSGFETLAENDDWQVGEDGSVAAGLVGRVGAFTLRNGGRDAALVRDLQPGNYTIHAAGNAGSSGVAIVEVYDARESGAGASEIVNLSNRGYVGAAEQAMIPGFAISDEGVKNLLLRVVGPGLGKFGVTGVLSDPELIMYRQNPDTGVDEPILTSDNWGEFGDSAEVAAAAAQVGAFDLESGSKDAAVIVTLPPGAYTVHAVGADGGEGVALVELYVLP